MINLKYIITFIYLVLTISTLAQQPFTAGNIVVYRVGNGSSTLSTLKAPVFLDEYTPAGVLVQSIAMPTTTIGSNSLLTATGNNAAEGMLNLSANGRSLIVPGGNTAIGLSSNPTANIIGIVDYNGNINTSTSVTDATESSRRTVTATSDDGSRIWFGVAAALRYTTAGSSSSVLLASPTSLRNLNITGGQLYCSSTPISSSEISSVGTGLPTTGSQTLTDLLGLPADIQNARQFAFADLDVTVPGVDVLYLADIGNSADPFGIRKFSLVGGSWIDNGKVGGASDNYIGLAISVFGSAVTIFATIKGSNINVNGGGLVKLIDNSGYNGTLTGTPTNLADVVSRFGTADVAAFKGIALVPQGPSVKVSTKIFLQGAYSSALSRHKDVNGTWAAVLNASALSQPFNTSAFGNYAGTETVSSGFFTSTAATTDILDWVLLELRDATTPSTVIARRAAFIREDGQIVDLDGTSDVTFNNVNNGNYYIVIRHRNHLSVRSATAISLSNTSTLYDFTIAQTQAFQDGAITTNSAMKDLGGSVVFGMWAGNANSNTTVRFTGLNNDAGTILSALGGNQAAILSSVYNSADLNMDGTVRYTGLNNDAGALLSVLGSNQAAVYTQHQ